MTDATVLVVDDEPEVADAYAQLVDHHYDVETAYGGEAALSVLAERGDEVDVVLLDRQMPGLDGDETLAEIREAGYDCRVAMVTAVDPDFDIVDLPFDEYVTKPASAADLVGVIERLLARQAYTENVQRHYALAAKKAALEAEKTEAELESSEEYRRLRDRLDSLRSELAANAPDSPGSEEWAALLQEVMQRGDAD